jgi:hypothetical protein
MAAPILNASFVKELVDEASKALEDGELTFNELISLGGLLAQKVGIFSQLTGPQKQELVIHSIQEAISQVIREKVKSNIGPEQLEEIKKKLEIARSFAENSIPVVLSLVVKASHGQIVVTPEQATAAQSGLTKFLNCLIKVLTFGAGAPKAPEKGVELLTLTKTADPLPVSVPVPVPAEPQTAAPADVSVDVSVDAPETPVDAPVTPVDAPATEQASA